MARTDIEKVMAIGIPISSAVPIANAMHGTIRNSAGHWGASEDALSFSFARRSRKEVAVLIMIISLFPRDFCFEFFFWGSISDVVK